MRKIKLSLTAILKNFQMQLLFMGIIIHARIKDGIIYPLEKIDLDDKEVLVQILKEDDPPFKTKIESSNEMVKQILEEELDLLL